MTSGPLGRGRPPAPIDGAMRLIEAVARLGTGVTAKELAAFVGMPPATCYRLLNTLTASEFLVRVDDLRGFAIGRKMDEIVTAAVAPFVPSAARDVLEELRGRIRFGVHLIIYLGDTVRVGDQDPDRPLHSEHDLLRHPHASAAGKLLLAHLPDWRQVLPHLRQLTEHTIIDPDVLDAELAEVRRTDTAHQRGELIDGIACCATPIRSRGGDVVGALCLAGPAARASVMTEQIGATMEAAKLLSDLIS